MRALLILSVPALAVAGLALTPALAVNAAPGTVRVESGTVQPLPLQPRAAVAEYVSAPVVAGPDDLCTAQYVQRAIDTLPLFEAPVYWTDTLTTRDAWGIYFPDVRAIALHVGIPCAHGAWVLFHEWGHLATFDYFTAGIPDGLDIEILADCIGAIQASRFGSLFYAPYAVNGCTPEMTDLARTITRHQFTK